MPKKNSTQLIFVAIIISGMLIATSIVVASTIISDTMHRSIAINSQHVISRLSYLLKQNRTTKPPPKKLKPGTLRVSGVGVGDYPIQGKKRASVLLVEFSDFQCGYSKKFYNDIFPEIKKEYIDTGKVKFAYRNFPLSFHKKAKLGAIAAKCANKQKKYWQMHDLLVFGTDTSVDSIDKYAKQLKLNKDKFDACLADKKIEDAIDEEAKTASKLQVKSTPTFFVNGRMIKGVHPFETFKKIIDEELAR
ncbi:MAG: DsbA family protein [Candidatus Omnitrophica bacterium]|nr:DsbA family protein [Candidatus Omnitrophota bacterium]